MTDDHRCIAAAACRSAEYINNVRTPGPVVDTGTLCDPCRKWMRDACHQLTRDYRQLEAALGDRIGDSGAGKVSSTPTPAILINTHADALMTEIVDAATLAAEIVADQLLHTTPKPRNTTPDFRHNNQTVRAQPDSIAKQHEALTHADGYARLEQAVRIVEPHIERLAQLGENDTMEWLKPERCQRHDDRIRIARSHHEYAPNKEAKKHTEAMLAGAYRDAATCDRCNGWSSHGQARQPTTKTGLDIALHITNLHQQARAHLGHTRLRHNYDMPCPAYDRHGNYCGAFTVGRDDGTEWVNCTTCGAQWTEREYDWLKTMVAEDKEIDMLRYLLAEAYWRLDTLTVGADAIREDPRLNEPGSGKFVLEGIDIILAAGAGHTPPHKRKTAA